MDNTLSSQSTRYFKVKNLGAFLSGKVVKAVYDDQRSLYNVLKIIDIDRFIGDRYYSVNVLPSVLYLGSQCLEDYYNPENVEFSHDNVFGNITDEASIKIDENHYVVYAVYNKIISVSIQEKTKTIYSKYISKEFVEEFYETLKVIKENKELDLEDIILSFASME
jgi:hypothetical protein